MKRIQESHDENAAMNVWDCGSPLYDSYELVAVSHVVERHLMVLPYLSGSRINAPSINELSGHSDHKPAAARPDDQTPPSSTAGKSSVLSFLRWNKRKMDGESKQKAKRQKTGISRIFHCRISSWKK
ncbi:hypothetical protein Salat_2267100 [Sesamum alatum]|uniref:Uncharacterized protein n=1 Tax=Sesamum alatum TaxID=300844 RepID=A0AAE1XVY9_9LAMI|nr:hypothetical protein Salat_2267100 [Sesamum alatum]